jgi:hypothetical protein
VAGGICASKEGAQLAPATGISLLRALSMPGALTLAHSPDPVGVTVAAGVPVHVLSFQTDTVGIPQLPPLGAPHSQLQVAAGATSVRLAGNMF